VTYNEGATQILTLSEKSINIRVLTKSEKKQTRSTRKVTVQRESKNIELNRIELIAS